MSGADAEDALAHGAPNPLATFVDALNDDTLDAAVRALDVLAGLLASRLRVKRGSDALTTRRAQPRHPTNGGNRMYKLVITLHGDNETLHREALVAAIEAVERVTGTSVYRAWLETASGGRSIALPDRRPEARPPEDLP